MWAAAILLCGAVADFVRPLRTHRIGADGHHVMLTVEADLDDVLVLVSPSGDSCSGHGHLTLHNSTRMSHGIIFEAVLPA